MTDLVAMEFIPWAKKTLVAMESIPSPKTKIREIGFAPGSSFMLIFFFQHRFRLNFNINF